jgi:hypothetical protein
MYVVNYFTEISLFCSIIPKYIHAADLCLCLKIPSSSSSICHGVGPLVDPFQSHVSRSLFKGLPWFLLPVGE